MQTGRHAGRHTYRPRDGVRPTDRRSERPTDRPTGRQTMRQTSCNIGRQAGTQTEDNRQTGRHVTIIHMQAYADRQARRRVTSRQRQWNRLGVSTGARSPVDNINGNGCACQLGGPCQLGAPCILRASEPQGVLFILGSHSAGLMVARMGQPNLCCFTSSRTNFPESVGGF